MTSKVITMKILQWNENYAPPSYALSLNPRRDHKLISEHILFWQVNLWTISQLIPLLNPTTSWLSSRIQTTHPYYCHWPKLPQKADWQQFLPCLAKNANIPVETLGSDKYQGQSLHWTHMMSQKHQLLHWQQLLLHLVQLIIQN